MKIVALILAGIIGLSGCGVGESPAKENPIESSPVSSDEDSYQYNWDVNPNSEFNGYIPSDELKSIVEDTMTYLDYIDKSRAKFALIDIDESDMGSHVTGNYYGEGPEIALYFPDLENIYIIATDDEFFSHFIEDPYFPNTFSPIENVTDPEIVLDYEKTIGLRINPNEEYHVIGIYWAYSDQMPMDGTDQYSVVEWNNLYV